MKRTVIVAVATALCLSGASAYAADPMRTAESRSQAMTGSSSWTMEDHMARASELEREALRLQSEAAGLETAERALLPYVDGRVIQESGVASLADQRIQAANEKLELASFHRDQALKLGAQDQGRATTGSSPEITYEWDPMEAY